jgi:hypothetical protein
MPPPPCLNLLCLLVLGLAMSLPALAAREVQTFRIEAGDATLTLNEFSRQSSLQLLFDYNIVRGRRTRAISGEYAAPAALRQMLADTGLVFDFVNERTQAVTLLDPEGGAGSAIAEAPAAGTGRPPVALRARPIQHELPAEHPPRAQRDQCFQREPAVPEQFDRGTGL